MKIVAVNGGPRRGKNTDQMLGAFLEGVKRADPDAGIETIRLYDYTYTGCNSCFACQLKDRRDELGCQVRDGIAEQLRTVRQADGIVFASPIYYMNVSGQLRSFWERLFYPGPSDRKVPTAVIYTMNAPENAYNSMMKSVLDINGWYLEQCFHEKPEVVTSCDTYQYNDNEDYVEGFRAPAKAKWAHHERQFAADLSASRTAGEHMVRKIVGFCEE